MENDEEMYQDRVLIRSSIIYSFIYSFDKYLSAYHPGTVVYFRNIAENKTIPSFKE